MIEETQPAPRKPWWRRWWAIVIWCVIAFVVVISIISAATGSGGTASDTSFSTQPDNSSPVSAPPSASSSSSSSKGPKTSFGNGTFEVGLDIEPGTYRSTGPSDSSAPYCSFARLRSAGGGMSDLNNVIDIQNVGGPAVVTIEPTDGGFFSQLCNKWEKASSTSQGSAATPRTSFGNGVFQVGVDIEPGTYVSRGPEDPSVPFCSYARLKSAGGGMTDLDNIIDIQNVGGQAIVTIEPSDGGFFSQLCQTWTKR